jgi:hypothetical protein
MILLFRTKNGPKLTGGALHEGLFHESSGTPSPQG